LYFGATYIDNARMKKGTPSGGMPPGRSKNQVKGQKRKKRTNVYFTDEELKMVEAAATRRGISFSMFVSQSAMKTAFDDMSTRMPHPQL
jgi:hypothetical protein